LTRTQIDGLWALRVHPLPIGTVASVTGQARGTAKGSLERLRDLGLVHIVDGSSGNQKIHRLTPHGTDVVLLLEEVYEALEGV